MKPVYHYTTGDRLIPIFESGQIHPATAGVNPPEIPAVWLSVAPQWERTASKGLIGNGEFRTASMQEMIERTGSLCRLRIDPTAVSLIWPPKLREILKIGKTSLGGLLSSARKVGANPSDWRAVAGPIPVEAILSIELTKEWDPLVWAIIDP